MSNYSLNAIEHSLVSAHPRRAFWSVILEFALLLSQEYAILVAGRDCEIAFQNGLEFSLTIKNGIFDQEASFTRLLCELKVHLVHIVIQCPF